MTTEREIQNARRDYERQCAEAESQAARGECRRPNPQRAWAAAFMGSMAALFIVAVLARAVWRWA